MRKHLVIIFICFYRIIILSKREEKELQCGNVEYCKLDENTCGQVILINWLQSELLPGYFKEVSGLQAEVKSLYCVCVLEFCSLSVLPGWPSQRWSLIIAAGFQYVLTVQGLGLNCLTHITWELHYELLLTSLFITSFMVITPLSPLMKFFLFGSSLQ